jgi:two-component system cell cycle sensor histidine kinase/response regulator CckA
MASDPLMEETFAHCPMLEGDQYSALCTFSERLIHDYNNLLLPLVAYPAMLRRQAPAAGEILDAMEQAAQSMQRINQGIMRLLPGGNRVAQETFRLSDLAEDVVRTLRTEAIPSTVNVQLVAGGGQTVVSGSREGMTRAIECLCRNGIEAMSSGGTLEIKASTVSAAQALPEPLIPEGLHEVAELVVKDTGVGIPPEYRGRIFDPFFTTKRGEAKRGAGMGLSIAYRTVRAHKGWIAFKSVPKGGSAFRIIVPASASVG